MNLRHITEVYRIISLFAILFTVSIVNDAVLSYMGVVEVNKAQFIP